MGLLDLCTKFNYFELEGKILNKLKIKMREWGAMWYPLFPIFAYIFIEEQKALVLSELWVQT